MRCTKLHLKSRCVWIGITDSLSPYRVLDFEACVVLEVSTPFTLSMTPAAHVDVTATADAMASQNLAGLGGVAFFPNGSEFQITLSETQCLWDWRNAEAHSSMGPSRAICFHILH